MGHHNDPCTNCGGTGWDSAARQAGMEDAPIYWRPIGIWRCVRCNGTGRDVSFLDLAAEALANQIREEIDADIIKSIINNTKQ